MIEISTRTRLAPDRCDGVCLYHTTELGIGHVGGLMPYGNANQIVKDMILRIRPETMPAPVYAGVCGADSTTLMRPFLRELKKSGVRGVQNFPSVGIADQIFRCNLEAVNLAYRREVAMLMAAQEEGLEIMPFAFHLSDIIALVRAKPQTVIYDLGFAALAAGAKADTAVYQRQIRAATCRIRRELPNVKVLLHVRDGRLRKALAPMISQLAADGLYITRSAKDTGQEAQS